MSDILYWNEIYRAVANGVMTKEQAANIAEHWLRQWLPFVEVRVTDNCALEGK